MEAEKQLPPTLLEQLNDDGELLAFNSWTGTLQEGSLTKALPIDDYPIYEKQSAAFVRTLGAKDFALRAALSEYIRHHNKDHNNKGFSWATFNMETVTWEDVADELEKVEAIYQDKEIGNPIRWVFRRGAAYTTTATHLLEAIPNDDGLGILKGAVLVVLKATEKRSQVCERIFRCFRDIPEIVQEAKRKRKLFPMDRNLFGLVTSLYQTLFDCIPPLIQILLRDSGVDWYKRAGKAVKATLGDQVAEVDGILQPLTAAQRSLQQAFSGLVDERDSTTARLVSVTQKEVGVVRRNQYQHHHEALEEIRSVVKSTSTLDNKVEVLVDRIERLELTCKESVLENPILNSLHILTAELLRKRQISETKQEHDIHFMLSYSVDIDNVLAKLYNDQEQTTHWQDLYITLRKHHDFSDKALAQPAYLASTDRFRHWLVDLHSDILLVDAHVGSQTSGRTSPMSVFCATLVQGLVEYSKATFQPGRSNFVLYHFCGLHPNRTGNLEGPSGLIRCLLGQLLQAWPRDHPAKIQTEKSLQYVGSEHTESDVRAACQMFQGLVSVLPPGTTIHCIIDGISEFDTELWGRSRYLKMVVNCLRDSVMSSDTSDKNKAYLKVLLTSANSSSKAMRDILTGNHQISLAAGDFPSQPTSPIAPALMSDELHRTRSLGDTVVQESPSRRRHSTTDETN